MKLSFEQSIPDLFLKKLFWLCRRGLREEARTISSAAILKSLPLPRPTRMHRTVHIVGRGTHRQFAH